MFTLEEVRSIITEYIIKDGEVHVAKTLERVEDEDTILKVRAAYLVMIEASEEHKKSDPNNDAPVSPEVVNKYTKEAMERLSVSNEINDSGLNHLIRDLLISSGHYEERVASPNLEGTKFSIFTGYKATLTLAYLKLKLREKGLDTDSLDISIDESGPTPKIIIDFALRFYKAKGEEATEETEETFDDSEYAKNELALAHEAHDEAMITYWQEVLKSMGKGPKKQTEPKREENIDENLEFIREQLRHAQESNDEVMIDYWNSVLRAENTHKSEPQVEKKKNSTDTQDDYVKEQLELAKETGDSVMIEYWQAILDSLSPKEEKKEEETVQENMGIILNFERALDGLKTRLLEAIANYNKLACSDALRGIRDLANHYSIDPKSNVWKNMAVEEKQKLTDVHMKASVLLNDDRAFNYWAGLHEGIGLNEEMSGMHM